MQVLISEVNKVTGDLVGGGKQEDAPEHAPTGSKQDTPIKSKQAVISAEAMVESKTSRNAFCDGLVFSMASSHNPTMESNDVSLSFHQTAQGTLLRFMVQR
jgi:hypothetical protein